MIQQIVRRAEVQGEGPSPRWGGWGGEGEGPLGPVGSYTPSCKYYCLYLYLTCVETETPKVNQ